MIIFDISNRQSYENLSKWIRDAKTSSNSDNFELVILGNKHDLIQFRKVTKEEAETFAAQEGLSYMETSAKTGHNVDKAF